MSSSRLRDQAPTIFDVFCEIVSTPGNNKAAIIWKYPDDYNDVGVLKSIAEFAYPTTLLDGDAVQLFTFVLTDSYGRYSFGYCRQTPAKRSCFCVLSALPWTDVFYRLLNHVAGLTKRASGRLEAEAESLLERAYHTEIPGAGERLVLDSGLGSGNKVEFVCPDDKQLPRIPDNRNLTEYYNAVREENMLAIFASLLCERRIIFTSSKLGKLSACILGASGLLYPMYWQHIFVPVLPDHLSNYLHAPMPFLIGVPSSTFAKIKGQRDHIDLSEVVVLNIDTEELTSPFNDFADLPNEVVQVLKKNLRSSNHLLGDGVARSFLRALVVLLGGYKDALQFRQDEASNSDKRIQFSEEAFIQSRPPSMRSFLEKMLHLQIFHQFIEERLAKWRSGEEPWDEFEQESSLYSAKDDSRWKMQYENWMSNMRKEKDDLLKTMKKNIEGISNRKLPSPSPIFRRSMSGSRSQQRKQSKTRSAYMPKEKSEQERLNQEDEPNNKEQEQGPSGSFFSVGGMDLLNELQFLMRPNSFIEKLEQQQQKFRGATVDKSDTGVAKETQEPLVSISNGDIVRPPAPETPAQEALLIDFGPAKVDVGDLEISDFDPLVSKSASVPASPKKQILKLGNKESTTITDLRAAAAPKPTVFCSNLGHEWEKFE